MNANNIISNEAHSNKKVIRKLTDLYLLNEIEDSKQWIEIINHKIKGCKLRKQHLIDNRPFFFQKKKLEEYNKKIESIDKEIFKNLLDIEEEIKLIEKYTELINSDY